MNPGPMWATRRGHWIFLASLFREDKGALRAQKTKEFMAAIRIEEPHPLLLERGEARENKLMLDFETWHLIYFCQELQHWLVYYRCQHSWFMKYLLFFMKRVIEGHRRGLSVSRLTHFLKAPPPDVMAHVPTLTEEMWIQSENKLEMIGGGWH